MQKVIPVKVTVKALVLECLSAWWDTDCTIPVEFLDFGEVEPGGESPWIEFYVRNDSSLSFRCLAQDIYPREPPVVFNAMFTPGLIIGNTNHDFEPGEVGWMSLQAKVFPGTPAGAIEFNIEIRPTEVEDAT